MNTNIKLLLIIVCLFIICVKLDDGCQRAKQNKIDDYNEAMTSANDSEWEFYQKYPNLKLSHADSTRILNHKKEIWNVTK